jgi:hypothetical protein
MGSVGIARITKLPGLSDRRTNIDSVSSSTGYPLYDTSSRDDQIAILTVCLARKSQFGPKSVYSSKMKYQMKSWILLNRIILKSVSIFQLFSSKDKSLLIWRNSFFVLNLRFNIFNSISWLNFKGDAFPSQGFHEGLQKTEVRWQTWLAGPHNCLARSNGSIRSGR